MPKDSSRKKSQVNAPKVKGKAKACEVAPKHQAKGKAQAEAQAPIKKGGPAKSHSKKDAHKFLQPVNAEQDIVAWAEAIANTESFEEVIRLEEARQRGVRHPKDLDAPTVSASNLDVQDDKPKVVSHPQNAKKEARESPAHAEVQVEKPKVSQLKDAKQECNQSMSCDDNGDQIMPTTDEASSVVDVTAIQGDSDVIDEVETKANMEGSPDMDVAACIPLPIPKRQLADHDMAQAFPMLQQLKDEVNSELEERSSALRSESLRQGLGVIRAVLADSRYEVPGGDNARKMLQGIAPLALRSAPSQRHATQEMAVGLMTEVFDSIKTHLQSSSAWAHEKVISTEAEIDKNKATVARLQKEILAKNEEVKQKAAAVKEADALLVQAQADLKTAEAVQVASTAANAERAAERVSCVELMDGSYKILREGLWGWDYAAQRQHMITVQNFLKELRTVKVPTSLIFVEGPNMLRVKPDQRPACAKQILLEIDAIFVRHLAAIDAGLESSASEVASSVEGASNAQAAVQAAKTKSEMNLSAQTDAELQSRDLRRSCEDLQKCILELQTALPQAEEEAKKLMGKEQVELHHWFKEAHLAFLKLRDQDLDSELGCMPTPSKKRRSSIY